MEGFISTTIDDTRFDWGADIRHIIELDNERQKATRMPEEPKSRYYDA
ncbi:MAG: hypothetical protein RTV41_06480 [Candidatus Thorarchaeota archaeon]